MVLVSNFNVDLFDLYIRVFRELLLADKILFLSHKNPDGDTLGSSNALYLLTKQLGKFAKMACRDDVPLRFMFLKDIQFMLNKFDFREFDLVVVSDTSSVDMTGFNEIYKEMFNGGVKIINLDHHVSNSKFGQINLIDVSSASTTVLIYKMLKFVKNSINFEINSDIAKALLCGIYNDTGSLMHSNVNSEVFEICAELVRIVGDASLVAKNLFKVFEISKLKLWGKVLEKLYINEVGLAVSIITKDDFCEIGASSEELNGVIDYINSIPGIKFSVLMTEDEKGNVKVSMRTLRDDVNLADLAMRFGGGGHRKASGFTLYANKRF